MSIRLLLLEDDPAIARTVVYALAREGWLVDHVTLVRDATARLSAVAQPYAAALLDIGLPDGSGLDLCRTLRVTQPTLPLVLVSARGEELDRVLGLELGADDYITKPFSPRELCARVKALLRRTAAHQATAPAVPPPEAANDTPLFHDDAGARIRLGAHWLPLTRREYGLLATLMRHPGRIWSRERLLDAVWGHDADSTDRTVDTHVKTLRAKLRDAAPSLDLIETHRGQGYSLSLPPPSPHPSP